MTLCEVCGTWAMDGATLHEALTQHHPDCPQAPVNMAEIQSLMKAWRKYNFPKEGPSDALHKTQEELGELAGSWTKGKAGIKGTPEQWDEKGKDAVGDVVLALMAYCNDRGFDIGECIKKAWDDVKLRDFQKYPNNGVSE